MKIDPERLVNSAQALIPYYPIPTPTQIDDVLAKMCKAFAIPFTVESDAKRLWRQRVGYVAPAKPALQLVEGEHGY